jgi:hypothetical protein
MSDSVGGGKRNAIEDAAHNLADGVQHAAERAQDAACKAQGGIGEVREVIRAQPITAALIVFALGYLFGRLGSLIPSGHSSTRRS